MKDIERLEETDVPMIVRAQIHNGEILGVTREGNLLIVAKVVGEQEDSVFNLKSGHIYKAASRLSFV